MIRKATSLVTAAATLYVCLLSQLRSGDALFLITSNNWVLNGALTAFAGYLVYISFQGKFKNQRSFVTWTLAAVLFSFIGLAGVVYSGIDNSFAGVIKPLDYVIFLQLGIIMGICSLSYEHQPLKFNLPAVYRLALVRLAGLKRRAAALLPKPTVLRAPSRSRPRSA